MIIPFTKVCVVEDNASFSEALELILNQTPHLKCVGRYRTAEAALEEVPKCNPDVLLLDLNLPGMSGAQLIWNLKGKLEKILVLVLTVHDEPDWIFEALEAGAMGYLTKPVGFIEILDAIADLRAGGAPMSAAIARKMLAVWHRRGETKRNLEVLTAREMEVLELLATGLTNKQIAQKLSLSPFTVRTHVAAILQKLHVTSRTEAAAKFLGGGTAPPKTPGIGWPGSRRGGHNNPL